MVQNLDICGNKKLLLLSRRRHYTIFATEISGHIFCHPRLDFPTFGIDYCFRIFDTKPGRGLAWESHVRRRMKIIFFARNCLVLRARPALLAARVVCLNEQIFSFAAFFVFVALGTLQIGNFFAKKSINSC